MADPKSNPILWRRVVMTDSTGDVTAKVGYLPEDIFYGELFARGRTDTVRTWLAKLYEADLWVSMYQHRSAADLPPVDPANQATTYRIRITTGGVDVICFGLESVDSDLEGHYDRVDDLPSWVQERLAVLLVLDPRPPTAPIQGVGRRISERVFWVFAPDHSTSASV
jgi:hypothetical protein